MDGWKSGETRRKVIEGVFGTGVPIKEAKADILVTLTPDDIERGIKNRKEGHVAVGCALSNSCARVNGRPALILRTVAYVPIIVKGKTEVHRFLLSGEARRYTLANDSHRKLIDTTVVLKAPGKGGTAAAGAGRSAKYRKPEYQRKKLARMERDGVKPRRYKKSKLTSLRMATARTAAGFLSTPLAAA